MSDWILLAIAVLTYCALCSGLFIFCSIAGGRCDDERHERPGKR